MKCAKCGKPTSEFKMILWTRGPNGNRRYAICPKCEPAVEADNNKDKKPYDVQIRQ
jgi:endogenous inhibitor of DNA gyrase (YacG/DUF329 family)